MGKTPVGNREELVKAVLAELLWTFLFVFSGLGSAITMEKLPVEEPSATGSRVVALVLIHTFLLFALISAAFNISGAHLNPLVTLGLAMFGHITIFRSLLYGIAQFLGAGIACYFLVFLTGYLVTPAQAMVLGVRVFTIGSFYESSSLFWTRLAQRKAQGALRRSSHGRQPG
ncbi:hypothetical protein SUGI_1016390 [Cryptomeria japonica]|uniref:probable aquaporin TIP4-3 n=1 Tax=Cryptomeria japonica TaxID=3369 RepID=UPI0024147CB5|nr:probable aquaporin TIP4-3 [Cryptomeria japonica]GLJ48136.1 hypothetical protein SUGI_1016390 [Cryptomeria japonica]